MKEEILKERIELLEFENSKLKTQVDNLQEQLQSIEEEWSSDKNVQKYQDAIEEKEELENRLTEMNRDLEWYKMWHNKFKKEIENLQTELETYRPTKLHGEGQCSCHKCKEEGRQHIYWTDWCYKYKGHIYCEDCLKKSYKRR